MLPKHQNAGFLIHLTGNVDQFKKGDGEQHHPWLHTQKICTMNKLKLRFESALLWGFFRLKAPFFGVTWAALVVTCRYQIVNSKFPTRRKWAWLKPWRLKHL